MRTTDDQLRGFVDDLGESLNFRMDLPGRFDDIIMCGMGGSAISSDIVHDICRDSRIPITVLKYPVLPSWAGSNTLVICSSYSGNTHEVLALYGQAMGRGCRVVIITSGGKLKELSERDHVMCIDMPKDMHPRHSIGFMIGYTLAVVREVGAADHTDEIQSCLDRLREFRDTQCIPDDCRAWKIAKQCKDRLPITISRSDKYAVCFRWKTQFNENSKAVAFNAQLEEFNRYAVDVCKLADMSSSVVLSMDEEATGLLENADVDNITDIHFEPTIEGMFKVLILGDYVSMYCAKLYDVDSSIVPSITRLKEIINEQL